MKQVRGILLSEFMTRRDVKIFIRMYRISSGTRRCGMNNETLAQNYTINHFRKKLAKQKRKQRRSENFSGAAENPLPKREALIM